MKTTDPIVERFRPPTYYEVVTGKPYRARIGKTKWIYTVNPFSAVAMVRVHELKDSIISMLKGAANAQSKETGFSKSSVELINGFIAMASLLWEIADKPKSFISRIRMRMAFFKWALKQTDWTFKIFENVLSANARISFFFPTPGELFSNSTGTISGDGFHYITRGHGDPAKTPWVEYLYLREAEKIDIINKWTVDKREHDKQKRNRR